MIFSIFKRFKEGFVRTQKQLFSGLASIFSKTLISEEDWQRFEANLYSADFGPVVVEEILKRMRQVSKDQKLDGAETLRQVLEDLLQGSEGRLEELEKDLQVVLLLGINGVGKTTTAAKLAYNFKNAGQKVLLGSCDTFRAAGLCW